MQIFNRFEKLLALHCAPTLSGIKPSNLISCQLSHHENIPYLVREYNNLLNCKNIFLDILCKCKKHYLILVYNKPLLISKLQERESVNFLKEYGYNTNDFLSNINLLKSRTTNINSFPHEIGIFLGYPIEDVIGFIKNKGDNYKFYGYWKVYSNEKLARALFKRYTDSREFFCEKILSGTTLMQLLDSI